MMREYIKSKFEKNKIYYSDYLINYINNLSFWKIEEFIENIERKINNLPWNRFLDGGEDWEVSTEENLIEFYFDVFTGEDYNIPENVILEILKEKHLKELNEEYHSNLLTFQQFEGEFKNGYKEGNWKYYTVKKQIIAEGEYLKGKRTDQWKLYLPYGTNELIEIRNYSFYVNEIPFFNSYYPNKNLRIESKKNLNEKYKTTLFDKAGKIVLEVYHDIAGQFIEIK